MLIKKSFESNKNFSKASEFIDEINHEFKKDKFIQIYSNITNHKDSSDVF